MQVLFLLQGDGRHLNEDQVVMALKALTGRPSWSISMPFWGERHGDDM